MTVKKIYSSELLQHWQAFSRARMFLPFMDSNEKGRKDYLQSVRKGIGYIDEKNKLFLTLRKSEDLWQVEAILSASFSNWSAIFTVIETSARKEFVKRLKISGEPLPSFEQFLQANGYVKINNGWEKTLSYRTGLVLGGGGARGAYQIGVWRALNERSITFDAVTGTSVGALNGALIAQGSFDRAIKLWEEIETNKVLAVAFKEVEEQTLSTQIDQLQTFLRTSLQQKGISSEPLRQLLRTFIDEEALRKHSVTVVTVAVPSFKETLISLNDYPEDQMIDWLLASSAFFPLMAVQTIDGVRYVDGGYRNNLPIDVALAKSPTELIIVDVHGPGVDKKVTIPDSVACLKLASPWSLGDLLLFNSDRSLLNIELGYLETQRALGKLQGYRYFFNLKEPFEKLSKDFLKYAYKEVDGKLDDLPDALLKFFKKQVPLELLSLVFLEFFAYWLRVSPLQIYSIEECTALILQRKEEPFTLDPRFSVQERVGEYLESRSVFSSYHQVRQLIMKKETMEKSYKRWPVQTLLALFFNYIQEEIEWQNLVTKS